MDVHPDHLKRLAEVAGLTTSDWMHEAELRANKRVPLTRLYDMLEHVGGQRSNASLGIDLAASANRPIFEPVEGICCKLPTLGDAMECWVENHPIVAGSQSLAFETFGDTAIMDVSILGRWRAAHDYVTDLFLARQYQLMQKAVGDIKPRVIQLSRNGDGTDGVHQDFFGCPTEFNAQRNRMVFDSKLLESTLSGSIDDETRDELEQLAEKRKDVTSPDIVRKIREVLTNSDTPQSMSLEDVADAFDVSARTLQRRMRSTGETLRRVRDDVQKEKVRDYIKSGKPFDEIADQLGYSELSAFYRAFKRWFGVTPADFRASITTGND
ncbi:MAG: helix-turn-helix domain-containing protein [Myxococcota bacterium]